MRQHVIPAVIAAVVAAGVAFGTATGYKPKPVVVQPQTTIVARAPMQAGAGKAIEVPCSAQTGTVTEKCHMAVTDSSQPMSRSELRQAAATWGELAQTEVDALTVALKSLPKTPVTIFCQDDAKCGDMQLDFDNAFETAKWDTKLETPLIDDTLGVATSREDLRDAIDKATSGRLAVKIIAKNAPFDVVVIGKKGK